MCHFFGRHTCHFFTRHRQRKKPWPPVWVYPRPRGGADYTRGDLARVVTNALMNMHQTRGSTLEDGMGYIIDQLQSDNPF